MVVTGKYADLPSQNLCFQVFLYKIILIKYIMFIIFTISKKYLSNVNNLFVIPRYLGISCADEVDQRGRIIKDSCASLLTWSFPLRESLSNPKYN